MTSLELRRSNASEANTPTTGNERNRRYSFGLLILHGVRLWVLPRFGVISALLILILCICFLTENRQAAYGRRSILACLRSLDFAVRQPFQAMTSILKSMSLLNDALAKLRSLIGLASINAAKRWYMCCRTAMSNLYSRRWFRRSFPGCWFLGSRNATTRFNMFPRAIQPFVSRLLLTFLSWPTLFRPLLPGTVRFSRLEIRRLGNSVGQLPNRNAALLCGLLSACDFRSNATRISRQMASITP